MVGRFFDERQIRTLEDLERWGYNPTVAQRKAILGRVQREKEPLTLRESFVSKFVADKLGEATTHWRKLEERVHRGVGNPCPLVLIGLPDSIVTFGEREDQIQALIAEVQSEDED